MRRFAPWCALAVLLVAGAAAQAQGPGGHGGMGGGMGRGMGMPGERGPMHMPGGGIGMGGPMNEGGMPRGGPGGGPGGGMRGGLQLAPPGRWWNDKHFSKSLGLNSDQQKRMDAVFGENRSTLLTRFENLQKAEARLEQLTRSPHPSESALFAEIDHVSQAHADLEKAMAHMQLQIRDEMTPEQIGKLDDQR